MTEYENRRPTDEILGMVTEGVDIYFDLLFDESMNRFQITYGFDKDGVPMKEVYEFQRFGKSKYDENCDAAYYIKVDASERELLFGSTKTEVPTETVEFRLMPSDYNVGKMNVTHIDRKSGLSSRDEMLMMDFAEKDKEGRAMLERMELAMLGMLAGHCKKMDVFAELPKKVKAMLIQAYGPVDGEEMWRAAMMA